MLYDNPKKESGVYKIKNLENNNLYIGSSANVFNRCFTHQTKLEKRKHSNQHLENAYHKYGSDSFKFIVIEYCDNITETEQKYIDEIDPHYNKRSIAQNNTGVKKSPETRKKISETLKERYKNGLETYKQQHLWREVEQYDLNGNLINTFKNMAEAEREVGASDGKLSEIIRKEDRICKGYQWKFKDSDKKIRTAISSKPRAKTTKVTNVKTGKVEYYPSLKEACETLGFPRGSIIKAIKADRIYKDTYKFEYEPSPTIG